MFAFFPYMPFGAATAVPCATMPASATPMPTFFAPYPTQPTPIFMHHPHPSPAMIHSGPVSSASSSPSSSPPSVQPSPPFLLYAPSPMLPSAPVVFSASPPSGMVVPTPPSLTTTSSASRRLPYLQPSPSASPSTSPRSLVPSSASASPRGDLAKTTTATTTAIPIPKAPARGGHHGPNCTCFSGGSSGGGSGGKNSSAAELSLTVLATTRKEERDPAYAEKLERYRNKMRRTAPVADPQRSLQASKRKRDALGKFLKEADEGGGRRTSARTEEASVKHEGHDDRSGGSTSRMHAHDLAHGLREEPQREDEESAMEGSGETEKNEDEERRKQGEESSPRARVDFLLN